MNAEDDEQSLAQTVRGSRSDHVTDADVRFHSLNISCSRVTLH